MAVLRSLVTTLGLNAAQFRAELSRSRQDFGSFASDIASKGKAVVSGIGIVVDEIFSLRTALVAIGTGAALVGIKEAYNTLNETAALGRNIGIAAQQWHAYAQAAEWSGSTGEKLADVIKDLNVKIAQTAKAGGDSGELADFFKQIGESAESWSALNPDQQLRKFTDELQKMSATDARVFLDSINDSAVELFDTLYTNHGQLIEFADQISKSGMALTDMQFAGVKEATLEINRLNTELGAVWQQVKASLAPAVSEGARMLRGWVDDTAVAEGGFQSLGKNIALHIIDGIEKATRAVEGMINFTLQSIRQIQLLTPGGVDDTTHDSFLTASQKLVTAQNAYNVAVRDFGKNEDVPKDELENQSSRILVLKNQYEQAKKEKEEFFKAGGVDFSTAYKNLDQLKSTIGSLTEKPAGNQPVTPAQSGNTGATNLSTTTQQQTATAIQSWREYAVNLKNELKTQSLIIGDGLNEAQYKESASYQKQKIELDKHLATALKAVGDNQQQNAAITSEHHGLMIMLQRQHEDEMTRLQAEAEQKRQAILKPLQDAAANYQLQLKTAKAINANPDNEGLIQEAQAHTQRMQQLQQQFEQQKTQALGDQQTMSELEGSYRIARESAEQLHEQNITRIKSEQLKKRQQEQMQAASNFASFTQNSLQMVTNMLQTGGKEQSKTMKVLLATQKLLAIPSILVAGQQAKAGAGAIAAMTGGIVGKTAVEALIDAQTGLSIGIVGATAIAGMAHDGIDNIPAEGTWLLDKGERVVDSRTNADLKNYLASNNGQSGGGFTVHQTLQMSGVGDDNLMTAMAQAAKEGARQAYQAVISDLQSRGPINRLIFG